MGGVERVDQACEKRGIDRTGRGGHSHFHRLAGIADVGFAHDADACPLDAVALERIDRVLLQAGVERWRSSRRSIVSSCITLVTM